MAEGVLFGVAQSILESLGSRAFQHIKLASNVQDEILKLTDTVATIKDVLIDAEKQQNNNRPVKNWLERLRDVMYDADDLLDDFSTELLQREEMIGNRMTKKVCIFFSKSNPFAYSHKMGLEIKTIREKLDAIKRDQDLLNLNLQRVESISNRQTHSFVDEEDVIGREDDKIAIKKLLFESNDTENVSVIPIVGLGGLGKTTLVQFVYNDTEVKNYFPLKMWVCVTDVFDWKTIVEKIIRSATNEELKKLDEDQLQKCLRENIDGKKYLLVLDDVWNENRGKWHKLKTLLKNGAQGSKIIVTTRSETVAKVTNGSQFHSLKGLPEDKSWSLFMQTMSKQGIELKDPKQVEVGKQIVARCVGVPLVIRVVGNLLGDEGTNWEGIRDYLLSNIVQEDDISKPLKLSYDHLPSYLKQCFAHCALFPQDYEFRKAELINLWMAQGFLQPSSKYQFLEDVGNEYFMNLLSRSFFQDVIRDKWGNIIRCKMHDLMHDLARSVAGAECTISTLDAGNVDKRARHISFDRNPDPSWEIPTALLKANHIRTFLGFPYGERKLNESNVRKILSSFKCLRTLNLSNSEIKIVPSFIGKLKRLRYLDLSGNNFKELPNEMGRLRNLETLGLVWCTKLKELPRDIKNMEGLRHLMIEVCSSLTSMPKGLGRLTSLQTLSLFAVAAKDVLSTNDKGELMDLKGLNNLRGSLTIKGLGRRRSARSTSRLTNLLKDKKYLQSLDLVWDANGAVEIHEEMLEALQPHSNLKQLSVICFQGLRISNWVSSLTNVTEITIYDCKRCEHLPPLDQLPSLKVLYLTGLDALEYVSSDVRSSNSSSILSTPFFPSLKTLRLSDCPNLKGWWKRDDIRATHIPSFPSLSKLDINNCPLLISMPLYPTLEGGLTLWCANLKPLQQTMTLPMTAALPSTSSSSIVSAPLSKLRSLDIQYINDLKSLRVEWLRNLTSLVEMKIRYCPELESLDDERDEQWQGLTSLRELSFWRVPKLVTLPKWLEHVTSLQSLSIKRCGQSSERCKNNMGVDWPKIAHIPNITIDEMKIQIEGVYQSESSPSTVAN